MLRTCSWLLVLSVVACGGGGHGDDSMGDDAVDPPDAGPSGLNPADCTAFASNAAAAATTCGTPLPPGGEAALRDFCVRGIADAAMCGGDPAGGLGCFRTPDATDWTCAGGEPYPACNGDLGAALGMYCLVALGNPACASGIACDFDVDCSDGLLCNSETHECFSRTAYCVGLPCGFDVDCPEGQTCNSAEGACIGS